MTALDTPDTLASRQHATMFASRSREDFVSARPAPDSKNRERWEQAIDLLIEWARHPAALADEDTIPPSQSVLELAIYVARQLRDSPLPPPTRVALDGDGGVVFERNAGDTHEAIAIYDDLSAEVLTFVRGRLRHRHSLFG